MGNTKRVWNMGLGVTVGNRINELITKIAELIQSQK